MGSEVRIRAIQEEDVQDIIGLYRAVYGDDFPFKEFYDAVWVKRGSSAPEATGAVALESLFLAADPVKESSEACQRLHRLIQPFCLSPLKF